MKQILRLRLGQGRTTNGTVEKEKLGADHGNSVARWV
jgi:hypothetical protein